MKSTLSIDEICVKNSKIKFICKYDGEWEKYLNNEDFYMEYNFSLENIPTSVLTIPLLCNLLPIAWVYDLTIITNEIDEDLLNSIDKIKQGYKEMYPSLTFNGKVKYNKVVNNKNKESKNCTASLFSGGVDAYDTLFRNIGLSPMLITLWGADIDLSDEDGWNVVYNYNKNVANDLSLDFQYIKTNFRRIINYENVSKMTIKTVNDEWWHGFQHGIGILGHVAPVAYSYGISNVYIASSFTPDQWGKYTCASDPRIDNNLSFCGCKVIHDGYEYNRQDKIHNIVEYKKNNCLKKIPIRVCWISKGGNNCCMCEKCYRTILGIIAEGYDPIDFGFNLNKIKYNHMLKFLKFYLPYKINNNELRYTPIQNKMKKNSKDSTIRKKFKWFIGMDIGKRKIDLMYKIGNKINKLESKIIKMIN